AFSTGIAFGYRIGAVTRDRPDQPYVDVQVPSTCSPSTCSPSTCSPSTCSPSTCCPSTCSPCTLLQKVYRADWLRVETVCCRYRSRYCSCRRGVTQAQSNKYRSCARARQSVDVTEDAYASPELDLRRCLGSRAAGRSIGRPGGRLWEISQP